MKWLLSALCLTQVVQGLVPDMGTSAGDVATGDTMRKLLGRRDLLQCNAIWKKCGGKGWSGSTCCTSGNTCQYKHEYYSQCRPAPKGNGGGGGGGGGGGKFVEESGGEFSVCIRGESQTWGPEVWEREWPRQGSAVTINKYGQCSWEEYAGGFDGFPSPVVGDGHEKGMDLAIKRLFPGDRNKQNKFLQEMIRIAQPIDLDHPRDVDRANPCGNGNNHPQCGERMRNIGKLNYACSQLITNSC